VSLSAGPQNPAPGPADTARDFLTRGFGFTKSDFATLNSGGAIVRNVDTKAAEEVALMGAVRISATVAAYIEHFKNIQRSEQGALQIGQFHTPPVLGDLQAVTLDPDDVWDLQDCRPGDCALQLPAAAIPQFHPRPPAPGLTEEAANRLMRAFMLECLTTYQKGGLAALGSYDDHAKPASLEGEFDALRASATHLPADMSPLFNYWRGYPGSSLPDSEDFFYWTKVKFGLKPTIRLNHVTIQPHLNRPDGLVAVIGTSQVYATHYFTAVLDLRFLIEDRTHPGNGFYLVISTQSRSHGFTGLIGALIKSAVKRRARAGMEMFLNLAKRLVENR
jgi:hypothetical protein